MLNLSKQYAAEMKCTWSLIDRTAPNCISGPTFDKSSSQEFGQSGWPLQGWTALGAYLRVHVRRDFTRKAKRSVSVDNWRVLSSLKLLLITALCRKIPWLCAPIMASTVKDFARFCSRFAFIFNSDAQSLLAWHHATLSSLSETNF
jgi:hypothetical protein